MKKKILFMSSAKLTALSIGLLLAVFCTIGMSFRPVYDEDEAEEIVMSGPRRGHYGGTCGDTMDKDYFKATAVTTGHGTVSLANAGGGGVITSSNTNPTSSATANASVSIEWNCNETTKSGTAANHKHKFTWTATPADGYNFIGWSTSSSAGDIFTLENPYTYETVYSAYGEENSHNASNNALETKFYAHFEEQVISNITFGASANGQYTYSCTAGSGTVTTADQGPVETGEAISMAAVADGGYKFFGWYTSTDVPTNYVSYVANVDLSFKSDVTLYAKFIPSTTPVWLIKETGVRYYDLAAAISACGSATRTIVLVDNGQLAVGNYTIPTNVTLLIPYDAAFTVQTSPRVVTSAATLMAYKILTLQDNVNIICNGKICVAGQMMAAGGGKKSAYVTGACGMIDMSSGGHIELNDGSKLYVWGFIKGQDMEQGNNTTGVGTITANAGSVIWEDFSIGDWRGGTATDAINNKKSSWKLFPFQSYSIQNIEVPVTYHYQAQLNIYTALNATGGPYDANLALIGTSNTLFLTKNAQSVVRKWYDPTSDLTCYELSGTSQLDALNVNISGIVNVNSGDFYLPISNNMHIILKDCNMTLSKPMTMQAGSVIEVKAGATANLESRLHMFDKDEWGKYIHNYYFRSFNNLTIHKNRGDEDSNEGLEDAKLIVDGTLNVVSGKGELYSTAGGANIMGNGNGTITFGGALPTGTTIHNVTVGTEEQSYIVDAPNTIASANLCNEDGSYTKSIASTTFHNVNGRWFAASAKDGNDDHTYDFTYIVSGAVSGTSGTNVSPNTHNAVYSWDKKAALELTQKWHNVAADACANWWVGTDTYFYNWTLESAWHQFIPTATEGMYSGSNNKIYTKTDCDWEELGETDVNCLYEIGGVKKALVDGQFIALEPNNNDPAYHAADDASQYYICFEGCNWHAADKYTEEEKAYIIAPDTFIWYNNAWMSVNFQKPFAYTLDETNVPVYYEYLDGEWVLAEPYVRVVDGTENRTYWFLKDAFTFANSVLRTAPTITILRDISGITTAVSYTGANKTCTLDLNGHTITGSVSSMLTINGAGCTFIIKDNTAEKKGKINLVFSANTRRYAVNVTKGHLKLQSGTISSTNTMLYSQGTSATSCAIIVKASQQCTIEGGTVYAQADYNPIGIYGDGNSSTITIKDGEVIASVGTKDSPRGIQVTGGTLNVQGGTIEATTYSSGTTGEGLFVNSKASYYPTLNMTGGTVKSTTKTSSIGVYVNCIYTYDTNEPRSITAWSRAVANISGGEIIAENKNGATAEGVRSYGTTNISGGSITVKPTTTTAFGVRLFDGTTTISDNADIDVAATSTAYGVRISKEQPANKAGTVYNGVLNMTGGTLTVRTTGSTDAYGVYVGAHTRPITTTHASNSNYYAGNYANAGTANISGGVIDVQARTNNAYSVYVENPVSESGATGYDEATATPNCSITGGKFKVASMTASATGIAATNVSTSTYTISGGYYNNQENVETYTTAPKHVVTLPATDTNYPDYLYKVANAYLVTFKNGDEELQSTYQESGVVPTYLGTEPKKASAGGYSYEFDGWSTTDGGSVVDPLPAVTSAGATYYAHFAETDLRYTIALDASTNGGECATEYIRVVPGTAAGTLPTAAKEGHTFTGWWTAASGGTQLTASTVVSGDITYYAQFTVNSYTLTYALGEGKVSTAGSPIPAKNKTGTQSKSVAYGTAITAPAVTRTGYTFSSWDAIVAATMPAQDVTYTPIWTPNVNTKYTVKHYLQNVDGRYPTDPVETQSLTGTTATSVTPEVKSYDGFVSPATQTVTIAAAGTTVVEYRYARRHYTFTLDAYTNGGTSEVPSIEVLHGATIGAVPPDAQKGCNDFTGWYTKPVGGVKITPEFVIEYDMKTLYAQFSDDLRTYPITYNAGANGTGIVAGGTKTCGVNTTLSSSTFTRTGYTQTGWSLTDGGGQAYALGGTYTANAAVTFYPFWTINQYTISFNSNGGSAVASITQDYKTAVTTPANPSRTGYTFNGWSPAVPNPMPAEDTECEAQWTVNTYAITYKDQGDVAFSGVHGDGYPTTHTYDATTALVDPAKTGYTFGGWYDNAGCTGEALTEIGGTAYTEDFTLYAKWTANTYEVTLDPRSGSGGSTSVTMTFNSAEHAAITNPTRTGYSFHSWNTTTSSTRKIVISSKGVLSENVAGYTGAGGVWIRTTMPTTLYARWTENTYAITFTHNGNGSISFNGSGVAAGSTAKVYYHTAKALVATPNTGYHFTGWTKSGTNASKVTIADMSAASTTIKATAKNATVTAGFAPDEYTITYKDQGDVVFSGVHGSGYPTTHTYGTATALVDPTKTGYTFAGWYDNADCTGTALTEVGATAYTADFTLYAKWTINQYKITFDSNGGSAVPTIEQDYNSAITTPEAPTKTGYTFAGWSPEVPSVMPAEDTECVAQWTANTNTPYVVKHYQQNLDGTYSEEPTDTDNETGTTDTEVTPAVKNYTGFTAPDAQTVTVSADGSRVVTYQYTRNSYNLTWDANGGELSGTYTSGSVKFGSPITAPTASRTNYDFDGWDEEPAATMPASDKTYTAQWSLSAVTILWKSEDGEETLETDDEVLIGATPSFDGTDPTKATTESYTYTFDGWTTEANGGGTCYATDAIPAVSAAATYYAHFAATANVASVTVGGATTYYTDFAEAWEATNSATGTVTLKLLQDVSGVTTSLAYTNAQNCTLDLNNHTLSGAVAGKLLDINATGKTFTIDDSSEDKEGILENIKAGGARYYAVFLTAGTLTLEHGTIHSSNPSDASYSSLTTAAKKCMASGVYVTAKQTFNMNGGAVSASAIYNPIGVQTAGVTNLKGGSVTATATKFTTAVGVHSTSTTKIYDGVTITASSTKSTTVYGVQVAGNTTTFYGGTIKAHATSSKGTTVSGIYVSSGTASIPATSTVDVEAKSYGKTCYGIQVAGGKRANIYGGTFSATSTNANAAYSVYSLGTTNITGGTFTATAKTSNARGVSVPRGTTTISGDPEFTVKAPTSVYGALASATTPSKAGVSYHGTLIIKGGTFDVEATSTTTAYGVYAGQGTGLSMFSTTNDSVPGNYINAGTAEISGGVFNVTAKTSTAYGVFVNKGTQKKNTTMDAVTASGTCTVSGGKFNISATSSVGAVNTVAANTDLIVTGGWYNDATNLATKYTAPAKDCNYHVLPLTGEDPYKYEVAEAYMITFKNGDDVLQSTAVKKGTMPVYSGEEPSKAADAQYTYAFTGWDNALVAVTEAATYTATFTQTVNKYTITWVDGNGVTLKAEDLEYGAIPSYTGTTPTKAEDSDNIYTFNGTWSPTIVSVTGAATYTAQFDAISKEAGDRLDIIDWTSSTLTINANGWKASGWPYSINGTAYYKDEKTATAASSTNYRAADRTLTINYSGAAGTELSIKLQDKDENVISLHKYRIPFIETTTDVTAEDTIYVNSGALTIDASTLTNVGGLYVRPEASVNITNGTLEIGKLVLRTLPWQAASISGNFTATETWYTRIAPNKRTITDIQGNELTYDAASYYQFALPLGCEVALKVVKVSNQANTPYGNTWLLKRYNEANRAEKGIDEANWVALGENDNIQGGVGYELFSNSTYYREFYFPVGAVNSASLGKTTAVAYDLGAAGVNHTGWNIVASPLMANYSNEPEPESGLKVSWYLADGSYLQDVPENIPAAIPFSYQASAGQSIISFAGESIVASAPRRVAATEEPVRIQWLRLDISDESGRGDQTSVYVHPTRYEEHYQTGIDVAKQSFEATRALLYSSHAYGEMAFAGVSDSLLEHGVALTLYSPAEQELTLSMRENEWLDRMENVWLIDKLNGTRTDLLWNGYTFRADAGTTAGRFVIMGRFYAPQIATGIGNMQGGGQGTEAKKVMMDQKIYIIIGGRMYDTTGKLVNK